MNWNNRGWGAERHWEQGSANGSDVKEVLGGKGDWGGAQEHSRETEH